MQCYPLTSNRNKHRPQLPPTWKEIFGDVCYFKTIHDELPTVLEFSKLQRETMDAGVAGEAISIKLHTVYEQGGQREGGERKRGR